MKADVLQIITNLINISSEYKEEYIMESIKSLASNWPNLTLDEKQEIEAVAKAFEIMAVDTDDETIEDHFGDYEEQNYSFEPTYSKEEPKRGLFRRKNR